MNKADADRFQSLMLGMADNFRDTVSPEGLRLRWEMLKGYTIEQVERAGLEIMRGRKFTKMPPVAEFVEAIEGQALPLDMLAEQQWGEVLGQIRAVGSYGTPQFDDPTTDSLLSRRFRFGDLCRATERELSFIRKEFIAAYGAEHAYRSDRLITYDKHGDDVKKLVDGLFDGAGN